MDIPGGVEHSDGQSQHWVPGAALPQYKTRYRSVLK